MDGLHHLNGIQSPPTHSGPRDLYDDPPIEDMRSMKNVVYQPPERACCDYYDVKDMMNGVSFSLKTLMDMIQTLTSRINDVDKVSNNVLTQVTTLKWLTHEMQRKIESKEINSFANVTESQFTDSLLNDPQKFPYSTSSTVTGSNKKLKMKMPLSTYSDIVLEVSDSDNDDDCYLMSNHAGQDMDVTDTFGFDVVEKLGLNVAQRDKGKKVVQSESSGAPSGKGVRIGEEVYLQRSPLTGKTLFESPPNPRVLSMSATIHETELTPLTGSTIKNVHTPKAPLPKRKTTIAAAPVVKSGRAYGYTIPRIFKCKFRPTPEMVLTQKEVQICAYLYSPDCEATELIFKCSNTVALRMDFDSFIPGKRLSDELMKVYTLKVTWNQYRAQTPTVWCLPPSFSEAVKDGVPVEDMVACFVTRDKWMPAYPQLKYIYVPVRDECHWYLMVISIQDEEICHLDSYLPPEKNNSRKMHIQNMAEVMAKMLQSDGYPTGYMQQAYGMPTWDISDAKGIPNCGRSEDSSIWVIDWNDMEHAFQQNLIGVLKEKVVRMRAALSIAIGGHNELYDSLVKKAMTYWKSIIEGDKNVKA